MKRLLPYAALGLAAIAGHVGYPAALWAVTRGRPDPVPPADPDAWPPVTVLVPAYRESGVLAAKIEDCRSNGYPGDVTVLVVADDPDSARVARECGALVIEAADRRGKSAALNRGIAGAGTGIVVLSDANSFLAPGAIAALVRWFAEPAVGAVAGEKRLQGGSEGLYWAFESWLKRRENRLGTTIGLLGECAAIRRDAPVIPERTVVDDFWLALAVHHQGRRVVYEPTAVAMEPPSGSLREEWERRTRIVAGAIVMLVRRPPSEPAVTFQVWGHRMWRQTGGPLAHIALLALASRDSVQPDGARRGVARLLLAGHATAIAGWAFPDRFPSPVRAAGQVLFLQAVGLGGMARLLRGAPAAAWPKIDRSGG